MDKHSPYAKSTKQLKAVASVFTVVTVLSFAGTVFADADMDGFSDSLEQAGFTLLADSSKSYPACTPSSVRANCVDWQTPDLFIVLERASPSLIPTNLNPFELMSNPQSQGGLGVAVHELNPNQVFINRVVTQGSSQVAAKVKESLAVDYDSDCEPTIPIDQIKVGYTEPDTGTPSVGRISTVNTKNIIGRIDYHCKDLEDGKYCQDVLSDPAVEGTPMECDLGGMITLDDLDKLYIKHTIVHEAGHQVNLGHHSVRSNWLMESYVANPRFHRGNAKWKIPTKFCEDCQAQEEGGFELIP